MYGSSILLSTQQEHVLLCTLVILPSFAAEKKKMNSWSIKGLQVNQIFSSVGSHFVTHVQICCCCVVRDHGQGEKLIFENGHASMSFKITWEINNVSGIIIIINK